MFSPIDITILGHEQLESHTYPLRLSVPFARGVHWDSDPISIERSGILIPCQPRTLKRWPDGSVKWRCLDWIQHADHAPTTTLRVVPKITSESPNADHEALIWTPRDCDWNVQSQLSPANAIASIRLKDANGKPYVTRPNPFTVLFDGPVCRRVQSEFSLVSQTGSISALAGRLQIDLYRALPIAICRIRIRNPNPSGHPNGNWDLGNDGSEFLRDLSFEICVEDRICDVLTRVAPDQGLLRTDNPFSLFQASSGGENWNSRNHLDKDRNVPMSFRGYQVRYKDHILDGLRATPQVSAYTNHSMFTIGARRFWENFPKSLSISDHVVRLGLFPEESGYAHELQGGEQKTYEFVIHFGDRSEDLPLDWYIKSITPTLSTEYYASVQAMPYLTARSQDKNTSHHRLVDLAIEGDDTFHCKREKIDEYGWRNYGDIYGDHEAVFHQGPRPLISHYNNQYDCTWGFATQFMRTGDLRWFDQMLEMAEHAWDIDTYHTVGDKNLYNGGLFWHTYHYADADTGTHRSYPRSLTQSKILQGGKNFKELGETGKAMAKNYGIGGGPSGSQNYSTGWMWAYYLTGQDDFREAAIHAADYVISIEDGRRTIFRVLCTSDTGLALESSSGYCGPGRASANSLHALLTGYELTENPKYFSMAEKLIQRVAHPDDNVEALDLGNAELRWFYTMHFQALSRYIDLKNELGQNDWSYGFAIATFNRYADWMSQHERPTLDHADRLQYPTETWAAQDMRKWHVLQYAAWMNRRDPPRAALFQQKADYFYEYVCRTLESMPTRSLCRPIVLMLHCGWQRHWFQSRSDQWQLALPEFRGPFGNKKLFRSQRSIAVGRAKLLLGAASLIGIALVATGVALAVH